MNLRKKLLFKVKNEVVVEEPDMDAEAIEKMKFIIAEECECMYEDVDVEIIDIGLDISEIDVYKDGMFTWSDPEFNNLNCVKLTIEYGCDEYLDALLDGTLDKFLEISFVD